MEITKLKGVNKAHARYGSTLEKSDSSSIRIPTQDLLQPKRIKIDPLPIYSNIELQKKQKREGRRTNSQLYKNSSAAGLVATSLYNSEERIGEEFNPQVRRNPVQDMNTSRIQSVS